MLCWREGQAQGRSVEEEGWDGGGGDRIESLPRP